MKNRIITISREFGSGGRTIGKMTAETLGIPCYDQELIEKLSEDSGFIISGSRMNPAPIRDGLPMHFPAAH